MIQLVQQDIQSEHFQYALETVALYYQMNACGFKPESEPDSSYVDEIDDKLNALKLKGQLNNLEDVSKYVKKDWMMKPVHQMEGWPEINEYNSNTESYNTKVSIQITHRAAELYSSMNKAADAVVQRTDSIERSFSKEQMKAIKEANDLLTSYDVNRNFKDDSYREIYFFAETKMKSMDIMDAWKEDAKEELFDLAKGIKRDTNHNIHY